MDIETTCSSGCALIGTAAILLGDTATNISQAVESSAYGAPWFWPLIAGVTGAVVASFSGVVVDRIPEMLGWREPKGKRIRTLSYPRSCCDTCNAPIPTISLIPILGWFMSKGRCASCKSKVPAIYPVIEAGTALASIAIVAVAGPNWFALASCTCLWTLLMASWLDWEIHEIPDFITVPLLFLGLVASPFEADATTRIWGAVLSGSFVWLAFKLTSNLKLGDTMSYGDIALATALGAWIGLGGAPYLLLASSLGYIAYALPLRSRGIVWVAMGPALSAGFMLVALSGIRI